MLLLCCPTALKGVVFEISGGLKGAKLELLLALDTPGVEAEDLAGILEGSFLL